MRLVWLIIFYALGITTFAQNERELSIADAKIYFEEISKQYVAGLSFETRFRSFAGESSSVAMDEFKGVVEISKDASYFELPGSKIYSKEGWIAQVLDDEKRIYISNNSAKLKNWDLEQQFNDFLSQASSISSKPLSNGYTRFILSLNLPNEYERVEYEFDSYDRLSKLTLITRNAIPLNWDDNTGEVFKAKIIVDYFNYKKMELLAHDFTNVIFLDNGKWIGRGAYKAYEIIELKNF